MESYEGSVGPLKGSGQVNDAMWGQPPPAVRGAPAPLVFCKFPPAHRSLSE